MVTTVKELEVFTCFGKGHFSEKMGKWVPSTKPMGTMSIAEAGRYIRSERAKFQTEELRRILPEASEQEVRDFKLREFDAVAFAGTFSYGSAGRLIARTPYIAIDIDDLASTEEAHEVQRVLVADREVETALCFLSPKARGVKWIAELPAWCMSLTFAKQYAALSRYLGYEYGLQADPTGSNVNRLCFLPFDPFCFINPKYQTL